ncbi:hypothetical protein D6C91_08883 [Aureobasidium pullulans]|uniref:Uncharacterized protein n=1 Tax=Aureobasidium pullulans TaxID=5580 RepID=A0A4S9SKA0_AURPU|nr:hypothetical protein D6C91_08883 [Aureobasidium pullulans]
MSATISNPQLDYNYVPGKTTVEENIVDNPKDLTALTVLTAEDLAISVVVHGTRAKVIKYSKKTEKQWDTSKSHILVRGRPTGKTLLDFNIVLYKD